MTATKVDIEALADEICRHFDKRSPFAFVSLPDQREQRFVGLQKHKYAGGAAEFTSDQLPAAREALISALRRRGRTVSDTGSARLMSPTLMEIYGKSSAAISMGLDIPFAL
jgi:hypothetical protein